MAAGIAAAGLLLDSNILIDLLRGEAQALAWIEAHAGAASISVISWIEVLVGCEPVQLEPVRSWLDGFARFELDQPVAEMAVVCRQQLGLKVPDAIILATARRHGLILATRNSKDFPMTLGDVIHPYGI